MEKKDEASWSSILLKDTGVMTGIRTHTLLIRNTRAQVRLDFTTRARHANKNSYWQNWTSFLLLLQYVNLFFISAINLIKKMSIHEKSEDAWSSGWSIYIFYTKFNVFSIVFIYIFLYLVWYLMCIFYVVFVLVPFCAFAIFIVWIAFR